jgi:hypothetical protein
VGADTEARVWLAGADARRPVRVKRVKGRAERGCDRLARRSCHGRGRGLSPSRGCMHTRAARCSGAVARSRDWNRVEEGREGEKDTRVHRSARLGEVARCWADLGCNVGK